MVNTCCICKLVYGTVPGVSFHRIPKREQVKLKWLAVIGEKGINCGTVCSNHFNEGDFSYRLVGDSVRRCLLPKAVPIIHGHSVSESVQRQTMEPNNSNSNNLSIPQVDQSLILESNVTIDSHNNENESMEGDELHVPQFNILSDKEINEAEKENVLVAIESSKNSDDITLENQPSPLKRLSSNTESLTSDKRACNPRYLGDLTREDFTSDIAYATVNDHINNQNKKQKLLCQKLRRLTKKVKSLKLLLHHLKKNGLITSEGCVALEFSTCPALSELVSNILTSKKIKTYPPELKEFACTLLFYSTSAYSYVRKKFMKCLPHPQTIRKWFSKIDLSPGISILVIDNLKNMIQEKSAEGVSLQFGVQIDEMCIKRGVEWDGKQYHGLVDLGLNNEKTDETTDEATYALVVMLVCINGHFKTPISYYFIKSLTAEVRCNILKQVLTTLYENDVKNISSLTFDGAATNIAMCKHLGAKFQDIEKPSYFEHPVSNAHIVVVPDACHMLKLVRNTTSEYNLIDDNDQVIKWSYLEKLVEFQDKEELHPGTKIRQRHIQFQKEKMKVKLAAQTLSTGVANGLLFMKAHYPNTFYDVDGTSRYVLIINDIFDFLNVRTKFGKNITQTCITKENYAEMEVRVSHYIKYIKGLKIIQGNTRIPILNSKRRIGFWGLIVAMKSALKLARELFDNTSMCYLLTYKLSQDHLETFFSCMRRKGGFNNNPTCRQFKSSYKSLVTHVNSIVPDSANCSLQDNTMILKSQIAQNNNEASDELQLLSNVQFEHDYVGSSGWTWSEYSHEIVIYIAGAIVRSIKKKIKCQLCLEQLEDDDLLPSRLIKLKNRAPEERRDTGDCSVQKRGGLTSPSNDVVTICKTAEKVIRSTPNLRSENVLQKLIINAKLLLATVNVFPHMDIFIAHTIETNHKLDLMNLILKKYFNIRLHHQSTCLLDSVQRIRSYHNRMVVFKNQ